MNSKELSLPKDTTCSGIGDHVDEIKSINNLLVLLNVAVGTATNNNNGD